VVVLEAHDRRPRHEALAAVGAAGLVAADLELALHGARHLGCTGSRRGACFGFAESLKHAGLRCLSLRACDRAGVADAGDLRVRQPGVALGTGALSRLLAQQGLQKQKVGCEPAAQQKERCELQL
jgi:hypothetical protein